MSSDWIILGSCPVEDTDLVHPATPPWISLSFLIQFRKTDSEGEESQKIVDVDERDRVEMLCDKCGNIWDMKLVKDLYGQCADVRAQMCRASGCSVNNVTISTCPESSWQQRKLAADTDEQICCKKADIFTQWRTIESRIPYKTTLVQPHCWEPSVVKVAKKFPMLSSRSWRPAPCWLDTKYHATLNLNVDACVIGHLLQRTTSFAHLCQPELFISSVVQLHGYILSGEPTQTGFSEAIWEYHLYACVFDGRKDATTSRSRTFLPGMTTSVYTKCCTFTNWTAHAKTVSDVWSPRCVACGDISVPYTMYAEKAAESRETQTWTWFVGKRKTNCTMFNRTLFLWDRKWTYTGHAFRWVHSWRHQCSRRRRFVNSKNMLTVHNWDGCLTHERKPRK